MFHTIRWLVSRIKDMLFSFNQGCILKNSIDKDLLTKTWQLLGAESELNANRELICKTITSVVSLISINCQLKSDSLNVIHFNITRVNSFAMQNKLIISDTVETLLNMSDYEFMLNKVMKRLISVTTVFPDITPYYI